MTKSMLLKLIAKKNISYAKYIIEEMIKNGCLTSNRYEIIKGIKRQTYKIDSNRVIEVIQEDLLFLEIKKFIEDNYAGGKILRFMN